MMKNARTVNETIHRSQRGRAAKAVLSVTLSLAMALGGVPAPALAEALAEAGVVQQKAAAGQDAAEQDATAEQNASGQGAAEQAAADASGTEQGLAAQAEADAQGDAAAATQEHAVKQDAQATPADGSAEAIAQPAAQASGNAADVAGSADAQDPAASAEAAAAAVASGATGSDKADADKKLPAFEQSQVVDDVRVTVQADEGTFPEGSTLRVEKVSAEVEQKVADAVEQKRDTSRQVAASYTFDIKVLDREGHEVQPADGRKVNVTFATGEVANTALTTEVFHISDDTGDANRLDVSEAGETAKVEVDGFSIYVVTFAEDGATVTDPTFVTYEFYNGENKVQEQKVKKGDTLYEPSTPAADANKKFAGWYVEGEKLAFDGTGLLTLGTLHNATNGVVKVTAKFDAYHYVTFYDQNGNVFSRIGVADDGKIEESDLPAFTPNTSVQSLVGWSATKAGTTPVSFPLKNITANADYYPIITEDYVVHFDANRAKFAGMAEDAANGVPGVHVTYTAPQVVRPNGTATEPTEPTTDVDGVYTFEGWYTEPECTNAYDWSQPVTGNITLYAKWGVAKTSYQIVVMKEKASVRYDDASRETLTPANYNFYESFKVSDVDVMSDATVPSDHSALTPESGFELPGYGKPSTKKVLPDGSTELKVYWNRQVMTTSFYSLTDKQNSSTTTSAVYKTMSKSTEFKGLYGQDLSFYGYDWPTDHVYYDKLADDRLDGLYQLTGSIVRLRVSFNENLKVAYYCGEDSVPSYNVYHVKQNADGSWTNSGVNAKYGSGIITARDLYPNFKVCAFSVGYKANAEDRTSVTDGGTISSSNSDRYVYHERQKFNISFYKDADTIAKSEDVYYERPLNYLTPPTLTPADEHTRLAGWSYTYGDTDPKNAIDFSTLTMPDYNIRVYPIWVKDSINVVLDLGANDATMNSAQARSFTPVTGSSIDMTYMNDATRPGFVLDGWYTKDGRRWNPSYGVVTTYCDKDENGAYVTHEDPTYKNNVYTLTLTARWTPSAHAKLDYNVVDGSGSVDDATVYTLNGQVKVSEAQPTAPSGKSFIGWKDRLNNVHKPGETFTFSTKDLLETVEGESKILLTAVYINEGAPTATVTYKPNYTGAGDDVEKGPFDWNDTSLTLADEEDTFTRSDYRLRGWSTQANATEPDPGFTVGARVGVSALNAVTDSAQGVGNIDLYAVWEEATAKITYNAGENGTVSKANEDVSANTLAKGSTATANDGYHFVKWVDGSGAPVSDAAEFVPTKPASGWANATYKAIFETNHTHKWTVAKDGDNLKLTCSEANHEGNGTEDKPYVISLPDPKPTYDGSAKTSTASIKLGDANTELPTGVALGTVEYSSDNGNTWATEAPTNAGTYQVRVALMGVQPEDAYATGTLTISPAAAPNKDTLDPKYKPTAAASAENPLTYDGTDQKLVKEPSNKLEGYTVEYSLNGESWSEEVPTGKDAGDYTVQVRFTGDANHTSFVGDSISVNIAQKEVSLQWTNTELEFTGSAIAPTVTATGVVEGDTCTVKLTENSSNTNVGDYTATAESLSNSNYKLPANKTSAYKIKAKTFTSEELAKIEVVLDATPQTYDGKEKKPAVTSVRLGGTTFTSPADYEVSYTNNVNACDATGANAAQVVINFKGNYAGNTKSQAFAIAKADPQASNFTFSAPSDLTYNASAKAVGVTAAEGVDGMGEITVKYYSDAARTQEVAAADVKAVGTYYVSAQVAEGRNYKAAEAVSGDGWSFTIAAKELTGGNKATLTQSDAATKATYNGEDQKETVKGGLTLKDGDTTINPSDYEVTFWKGNTQVTDVKDQGTYTVKVTFKSDGNYAGSDPVEGTFTIDPKELTADDVTLSPATFTYDPVAEAQKPSVTVKGVNDTTLAEETDYDVVIKDANENEVANPQNVGTYTVVVTGKGNYKGTITKTYTIAESSLKVEDLKGENKPNNGKATATLTYNGQDQSLVTAPDAGKVPAGYELKYKLSTDDDSKWSTVVPTGKAAGEYTVQYKYAPKSDNYAELKDDSFSVAVTINKADLGGENVVVSTNPTSYIYDGSEKKPEVTVTLNGVTLPTSDYDVSYDNNVEKGTATVTVKAKENGNCTGSKDTTFSITAKQLQPSDVTVTFPTGNDSPVYNGQEQKPKPTVVVDGKTLTEGKDYDVEYPADTTNSNNSETKTAKIVFKGDYANADDGTGKPVDITGTYVIKQAPLSIKAKDQVISHDGTIATGVDQVTVTGLVSGETLSAITLEQSTNTAGSIGTINAKDAAIKKGDADVTSNYAITYDNTGKLTIKAEQSAPSDEDKNGLINKQETTSITINTKAGYEYVITTSPTAPADNADWSTVETPASNGTGYHKAAADGTHEFTGLTKGTAYYVHMRKAAVDPDPDAQPNENPGADPSPAVTVPTSTKPEAPDASKVSEYYDVDYDAESLTPVPGYEIYDPKADGGNGAWVDKVENFTPGGDYKVRVKATETVAASEPTDFKAPERPDAPNDAEILEKDDKSVTIKDSVAEQEYIILPAKDENGQSISYDEAAIREAFEKTGAAVSGNGGGLPINKDANGNALAANTEYVVYNRTKAVTTGDNKALASTPAGPVKVTTKKSSQDLSEGDKKSVQDDTWKKDDADPKKIVVNGKDGYEYLVLPKGTAAADVDWSKASKCPGEDADAFTRSGEEPNYTYKKEFTKDSNGGDIAAGTDYEILVRKSETATDMPSNPETVDAYTTREAPESGKGYKVDYPGETVTAEDGYEIRKKGDQGPNVGWTSGPIAAEPGAEYEVRKKEVVEDEPATVKEHESAPTSFTLGERPKATEVGNVDKTDTTLTVKPSTKGQEYIVVPANATPEQIASAWNGDGKQTSKDGEDLTFSGLTPDTEYKVITRVPAKEDTSEGGAQGAFKSDESATNATTKRTAPNVNGEDLIEDQSHDTITVNTQPGYEYVVTTSKDAPAGDWSGEGHYYVEKGTEPGTHVFGAAPEQPLSSGTDYYVHVRAVAVPASEGNPPAPAKEPSMPASVPVATRHEAPEAVKDLDKDDKSVTIKPSDEKQEYIVLPKKSDGTEYTHEEIEKIFDEQNATPGTGKDLTISTTPDDKPLKPGTDYVVYNRYKAVIEGDHKNIASDPGGPAPVTTKNSAPDAPEASATQKDPEPKTVTVDGKAGIEYILVPKGTEPTDADWESSKTTDPANQDGPVTFDKTADGKPLEPGKDYEVFSRTVETDDTMPSKPRKDDAYTTREAPKDGEGYEVDYPGETIEIAEGYELRATSPTGTEPQEWTSGKATVPLTPGATYEVRKKADHPNAGDHESEPTSFTAPERPAAPDPVKDLDKDDKSVTIKPSDEKQEYIVLPKKSGGTEYTHEELEELFKKGATPGTGEDLAISKTPDGKPLEPGTDYVVYNRTKAVAEGEHKSIASEPAGPAAVTTKNGSKPLSEDEQNSIKDDTWKKDTANPASIFVNGKAGYEYLVLPKPAENPDWSKATKFDKDETKEFKKDSTGADVKANTDYAILVRKSETGTDMPSEPVAVDAHTLKDAPKDGEGYEVDYPGETIEIAEGYELRATSPAGTEPQEWTSGKATVPLTPGATYEVRKKADHPNAGDHESEPTSFTAPERPATPAPVSPDAITKTETTVKVEPTVPGQQYILVPKGHAPTEDDWANAGKTSEKGEGITFDKTPDGNSLVPGTEYEIVTRVPASGEGDAPHLRSEASAPTPVKTELTKPEPAPDADEKPSASPTTVTIEGCDQAQEYVIVPKGTNPSDVDWSKAQRPGADNKVTFGKDANGNDIVPGKEYTVLSRKPGDATHEPSEPAEINVKTPRGAGADVMDGVNAEGGVAPMTDANGCFLTKDGRFVRKGDDGRYYQADGDGHIADGAQPLTKGADGSLSDASGEPIQFVPAVMVVGTDPDAGDGVKGRLDSVPAGEGIASVVAPVYDAREHAPMAYDNHVTDQLGIPSQLVNGKDYTVAYYRPSDIDPATGLPKPGATPLNTTDPDADDYAFDAGETVAVVTFQGDYAGTVTAPMKIEKRTFHVVTPSAEKAYDGTALTAPEPFVWVEGGTTTPDGDEPVPTGAGLVGTQRVEVEVTGSQKEVGEGRNTYRIRFRGEGDGAEGASPLATMSAAAAKFAGTLFGPKTAYADGSDGLAEGDEPTAKRGNYAEVADYGTLTVRAAASAPAPRTATPAPRAVTPAAPRRSSLPKTSDDTLPMLPLAVVAAIGAVLLAVGCSRRREGSRHEDH